MKQKNEKIKTDKTDWKTKIITILIVGVLLTLVIGFNIMSQGELKNHKFKTFVTSLADNDKAITVELSQEVAKEVNNVLNNSFQNSGVDTIKIFENEYIVTQLNSKVYRVLYQEDTIILKRLNETRIQAMNLNFISSYVDEINEFYEN